MSGRLNWDRVRTEKQVQTFGKEPAFRPEGPEPERFCRKLLRPVRMVGTYMVVTDLRGKEHRFSSMASGLLYAASLYRHLGKRPRSKAGR